MSVNHLIPTPTVWDEAHHKCVSAEAFNAYLYLNTFIRTPLPYTCHDPVGVLRQADYFRDDEYHAVEIVQELESARLLYHDPTTGEYFLHRPLSAYTGSDWITLRNMCEHAARVKSPLLYLLAYKLVSEVLAEALIPDTHEAQTSLKEAYAQLRKPERFHQALELVSGNTLDAAAIAGRLTQNALALEYSDFFSPYPWEKNPAWGNNRKTISKNKTTPNNEDKDKNEGGGGQP